MKVNRNYAGFYTIQHNGRTFEVEDIGRYLLEDRHIKTYVPHWNLFEIVNGNRDCWNTLNTLAQAKHCIEKGTE